MAPPGKHFMSVFVQYVPPKIHGRDWTDEDRDGFRDTVLDQIARYSPNFKQLIRHVEVRTPRELEAEVGLTEGNIFQGELTMDQLLFNRPFPGFAQYRGPVEGLLHVRLGHAPGRRRHGGARRKCRARDPARPAQTESSCLRAGRMTDRNRIVVIGGGHNGLACAAYLAKCGARSRGARGCGSRRRRRRDARVRAGVSRVCRLRTCCICSTPAVRRELDLAAHGLKAARSNLKTVALAREGEHLVLDDGRLESGTVSADDRAAASPAITPGCCASRGSSPGSTTAARRRIRRRRSLRHHWQRRCSASTSAVSAATTCASSCASRA